MKQVVLSIILATIFLSSHGCGKDNKDDQIDPKSNVETGSSAGDDATAELKDVTVSFSGSMVMG